MTHHVLARALLLLATTLSGLAGRHQPTAPIHMALSDARVLKQAARSAAHHGTGDTIRWLRHQPVVASAGLGPDHRTIEVQFRGGVPAAILPPDRSASRPQTARAPRLAPRTLSRAPAGRAIVLEPFATVMNLGPNAGDAVTGELQAAGFAVTQLYDAQVTVDLMSTLSQYNLVYLQTHSGVNPEGEAVLATGQLAADQSGVQVSSDYATMTVGVTGSDKLYEGVLSRWFADHDGQFPSRAFLFVNSCGFLMATQFWQVLQAKGVSAVVGWTDWSMSLDEQIAAKLFFQNMNSGMNVAAAVNAVAAAGHGDSTAEGRPTAHFGYLGDGTLTLHDVLPPPPTETPSPTPTATPVPRRPHFAGMRPWASPGSLQTIPVTTDPGAAVHFEVRFPNADLQTATLVADSTGHATYSYVQRSSEIRHDRAHAAVRVSTAGGSIMGHYVIRYGPIDVSVEPRQQAPGRMVSVWVHSWLRAPVTVEVGSQQGRLGRLRATTGDTGWTRLTFRLPASRHGAFRIGAMVSRMGRLYRTASTLRVP